MLLDFHCHYLASNAIYCTAKPEPQLETIQHLQVTPFLYCQGLLPQYWKQEEQEKLMSILNKNKDQKTTKIHLGEVGLDKRYKNQISLQQQEENLLTILQYANKLEKIVTIHSVQATERTIKILKQAQLKPWKTIWHGFNGSIETAEELYKMKIFISIGPRYNKQNLKDIANVHPNFVLETDYNPQDNETNTYQTYNSILQRHYQNCATQLEWTVEDLKEHCYGQAKTLTN